jgi:hypothetical protein
MDRYVALGSRKLQRVAYNNFGGAKRGHGEILNPRDLIFGAVESNALDRQPANG